MSWAEELYKIYELNCNRSFSENEPVMLPISHSSIKAHLQITINENGEFKGVEAVAKGDENTVIPNTGKAKTGKNPPPYPMTECLKYVAGDFGGYKPEKVGDCSNLHDMYIKQLMEWKNSCYTHKAVKAVYEYVSKKTLTADCIKSGVLETQEDGRLFDKQYGNPVEKLNVRFIVNYNDLTHERRTWKDTSLYDSFINYNSMSMGEKQLCYALGEELPPQYIHPIQILNRMANAKLISSNDDSGFTYRGRFNDKYEAISISYQFSEKMHNALKWLIAKQGMYFDTMAVIVWASGMQDIPDIRYSAVNNSDDEEFFEEDEDMAPTTAPMYQALLKKRIFGYGEKFDINTKVMILAIDAASKGRASISFYSELEGSEFLGNINNWHFYTSVKRHSGKKFNSFSLYDIANCAFGTEMEGKNKLECKPELLKETILRLIPCVTMGAAIPSDIIQNLYNKASNPLAYSEKTYNHRLVLETACGMIRKYLFDRTKGDILMAYDPNLTDRSYLYGCLLAIADKAESESYDPEERNDRITNARRYWNTFSQRPYQAWRIIEERLRPYLDKLGKAQVKYSKWINEITSKMLPADFSDNRRLEPIYLLGYHHFTDYMYNFKSENKEEK